MAQADRLYVASGFSRTIRETSLAARPARYFWMSRTSAPTRPSRSGSVHSTTIAMRRSDATPQARPHPERAALGVGNAVT
jgi:hypothetical protein